MHDGSAWSPARHVGALLPIQNVPDHDFGELHDQLPQLLVFFQERIQVRMIDVGSTRVRVELTVAIRRVHACHGCPSHSRLPFGFLAPSPMVDSMRDSARFCAVARHPKVRFSKTARERTRCKTGRREIGTRPLPARQNYLSGRGIGSGTSARGDEDEGIGGGA